MSSTASFSQIIFAETDGVAETGRAMWAVVDGTGADFEPPLHPVSNARATSGATTKTLTASRD